MGEILTSDYRMNEVIQLAKTVASSKATILIQDESGTGKELIASLIHRHSSRAGKSMVAINCAAIPENLLESELFGYEKGAFTGATNSKAGKFELAHGGTLLLDEISEMDIRLQAKLLRVIQEGEVDRIGGLKPALVDVRIIATTNRNLTDCVRQGLFREDLFYRLNVVNLTLPPLRDRIGDVSILTNHFMSYYSKKNDKQMESCSSEAIAILNSHNWPGNIRELENVVERAIITSQGNVIILKDICINRKNFFKKDLFNEDPLSMADLRLEKNWAPGRTLDDIERDVIIEALKYHRGNRTHTAIALGISIRTLRNKIADYKKLGIQL